MLRKLLPVYGRTQKILLRGQDFGLTFKLGKIPHAGEHPGTKKNFLVFSRPFFEMVGIMHAVAHVIERDIPVMVKQQAVAFVSHIGIAIGRDAGFDENQIALLIVLLYPQRIKIVFIQPIDNFWRIIPGQPFFLDQRFYYPTINTPLFGVKRVVIAHHFNLIGRNVVEGAV